MHKDLRNKGTEKKKSTFHIPNLPKTTQVGTLALNKLEEKIDIIPNLIRLFTLPKG